MVLGFEFVPCCVVLVTYCPVVFVFVSMYACVCLCVDLVRG